MSEITFRYNRYDNEISETLFICLGEEIVGQVYIGVTIDIGHISSFIIKEQHRRKGYATQLMKKLIERHGHRELSLQAHLDNPNKVVPFYHSFGFVIKPERSVGGSMIVYMERKKTK
jgi:ribosomal protein S18 acetylase RimI-like enzyme